MRKNKSIEFQRNESPMNETSKNETSRNEILKIEMQKYQNEVPLYKEIHIEPYLLICNTKRIIKDKLWEMIKSHCSGDYGFVLQLKSIDQIGVGAVDTTNGNVIYPVNFTILAFKPDINDVIRAMVTDVTKSGFFCILGPLEIYVPQINIPDVFFSNNELTIKSNDIVTVKIDIIQKINTQIKEDLSQQNNHHYKGGILTAIGELIGELISSDTNNNDL